ncbi:MAG: hypothetical protein ACU837_15745 [Gammaproteobacteria bacterium]
MANITYTQEDDTATPGTITIDSLSQTVFSGPPNYGRLDNVGDLVFAEFSHPFTSISRIRVECIRTANDAMTIRVIIFDRDSNITKYGYDAQVEKVVENVSIDFK